MLLKYQGICWAVLSSHFLACFWGTDFRSSVENRPHVASACEFATRLDGDYLEAHETQQLLAGLVNVLVIFRTRLT